MIVSEFFAVGTTDVHLIGSLSRVAFGIEASRAVLRIPDKFKLFHVHFFIDNYLCYAERTPVLEITSETNIH